MNKILVKEILELAKGKPTTLMVDDDIFGILTYKFESYDYKFKEDKVIFTNKKDILDVHTYDCAIIREISVETDDEHILEIISKATTMLSIVPFIWNIPFNESEHQEVEEALQEKQDEFFKLHLSQYIRYIKDEIQEKINEKGFEYAVEKLFIDLVVNILGKEKIETKGDFDTFKQSMNNIDDLIVKIIKNKEKEVF